MMKAYRCLLACGAGRPRSGRLATAQHLCGALVGLVNPGLVGIGLSEGREHQFVCWWFFCSQITKNTESIQYSVVVDGYNNSKRM